MKLKTFIMILISMIILCTYTYAEQSNVIGHIYPTDIQADIDGMPIKSYNTGEKTLIMVEDLKDYGFDIYWYSDDRKFDIVTKRLPEKVSAYEKENLFKALDIYNSNVNVKFNGVSITSYNIDGKTAIAIEDLGQSFGEYRFRNRNSELGYSNYACQVVWNEKAKNISLKCLRPESIIHTEFGDAKVEGFSEYYHEGLKDVRFNETWIEFDIVKYDTTYISINNLIGNNLSVTNDNGILNLELTDKTLEFSECQVLSCRNCAIPLVNFNIKFNNQPVNTDTSIPNGMINDGKIYLNLDILEKYNILSLID